nr:hypothetical protein [Tanacetum cinerariifolium]
WPPRVTLGRLLPHARGLGFKPRRGGFPSGAKKEWGLSPMEKIRVLHTAQLDVTKEKADVALTCPVSDGEPLHLALRMDGIKEESPQKLQVTMVTSMSTVQTHARLHANSVSHSPQGILMKVEFSRKVSAITVERFNNVVSFEEELAHQRLRKTLTRVLELSSCIYLDDRAWGLEF